MSIRRHSPVVLFLFVGMLSLLILPGCQRHRVPDDNQMQMGQGPQGRNPSAQVSEVPTVLPANRVAPSPRFVVQSGQDYYVDSRGALHQVLRREVVSGGGLYYLEGDERGYLADEHGRLYHRESAGNILYYEDASPRVVETRVVPGKQVYMPAPVIGRESCESQYQECMSGCQSISPREAYDRPNCVSMCEQNQRGCQGR